MALVVLSSGLVFMHTLLILFRKVGVRATWKREFKLPWREVGPHNNHDDEVDSDQ